MVNSAYARVRDFVSLYPFRWGILNSGMMVLFWISCAAVFTTLQLILRYNHVDHDAWIFVFLHRLPAWGQWMLWTPVCIGATQFIILRQPRAVYAASLIVLFLLVVSLLATTLEAVCSFAFWGAQEGWGFRQVLFAFIVNRLQNHLLITFFLLFLYGLRLLMFPGRQKGGVQPVVVNWSASTGEAGALVIRHKTHTQIIPFTEIDHVSASGSYVEINTDKGKVVATGALKSFESQLPYPMFVRIHRSYIVRTEAVRTLSPLSNEDHRIITVLGNELRLSRTYKEALGLLTGQVRKADRPAN